MEKIEELTRYAQKVKEARLIVSSSGNISVRLDRGSFAISSSGAMLGELCRKDISICYLDKKSKFKGPEPSMEVPFHREIYKMQSDAGAVLHFQSLYATTLACARRFDFNLNFIPEISVYIKNIQVIPYIHPGSEELAVKVGEKVKKSGCNIIVLKNHGLIAIGKDLAAVLRNAEFFEFACRMTCQGIELQKYSKKIIKELRDHNKT